MNVASESIWRDAPYTAHSACDWLIQRRVKAVGYDYPPDYCTRITTFEPEKGKTLPREDSTTHHALFSVGTTVIEYLTNLDQIGMPRYRFLALPLTVEGADGSPVHVWPWWSDRIDH